MADYWGGSSYWLGFLASINAEVWDQGLSSALSQYRLFDPSWAMSNDLDAYGKLWRDPVVSKACYLRKLGAAGTAWSIVPSDPSPAASLHAKMIEAMLGELDDFLALRFNLSEAIISGSRWARMWWEERKILIPGTQESLTFVVPSCHRDVDKRRFRQFRTQVQRPDVSQTPDGVDENGDLAYRRPDVEFPWQVWRPIQRMWTDIREVTDDGGTWVKHVADDTENSLGYGNGVADALFTPAWMRGQVVQYMLAGLESWSQGGVWVAEIENLIQNTLAAARYQAAQAAILPILKAAKRNNAIAIPKGDKVTLVAPSEAWLDECIRVLVYLDDCITGRVLFSIRPTGGGADGSSLARTKEEANTTMSATLHDRARLQDSIQRYVIKPMIEHPANAEQLAKISLGGISLATVKPGTIRIMSEGSRESLASASALVEVAKVAPIRQDEFYERLGLTPPGPNDKVVFVAEAAAKAEKFSAQAQEEQVKAGEHPTAPLAGDEQKETAFLALGSPTFLELSPELKALLVQRSVDFAAGKRERGWNVVYTWVCKCDDASCKGCAYLGKNGPYTWSTLPTFPGTRDTPCGGKCRCLLRARPADRQEFERLSRRLPAVDRLERIQVMTGYRPETLVDIETVAPAIRGLKAGG